MPHAAQIISIIRMLGLGNKRAIFLNEKNLKNIKRD
jgi:hypothetical protein